MDKAKRAKNDQSFGDLQKMILDKRQNAFSGFLNYAEQKYVNPKKRAPPQQEEEEKKSS